MHGGQDVRFSIAKCDDARKFCNKLWQAARFAIDLANEGRPSPSAPLLSVPDETSWTLPDRWIMDALARTAGRVTQALEAFDFAEAAQTLYTFVWNQACDVYIEIAKDKAPTRAPILTHALATALQLLHPIMPFVTEELWGRLGRDGFIGESAWPSPSSGWLDDQARTDMTRLLEFVEAVRALRALPKLPYRELRDVTIVGADKAFVDLLQRERGVIARLARAENVHAPTGPDGRPKHAVSRRLGAMEVLLPVDEAFVEKERTALDKEIARAKDEADTIERKLQTNFIDKAPAAVVEKERARLAELRQGLAMSQDRRAALK
jgi:valyl-tRNA synthetase